MKLLSVILALFFCFQSEAKGIEVNLGKIKLFDGSIEILVPKEFKSVPDHQFKPFYSPQTMPKLVYLSETKEIRIAFDSKSLASKESDLPRVTATMKAGLQKLHPKAKWKDSGVKVINGHKVGFIDYLNKKPEKFFELLFFASYKGQMVSCTFHAPKKGYKAWKAVAYEIMESFTIVKKK
jgi:hypothetical protein